MIHKNKFYLLYEKDISKPLKSIWSEDHLPETGISSEKSEYAGDGIDSELKSLHLKYVPAVK